MTDITPNRRLHVLKLRNAIDDMELRIRKDEVRKMELDDQKSKIDLNIEATREEVENLQKKLQEAEASQGE